MERGKWSVVCCQWSVVVAAASGIVWVGCAQGGPFAPPAGQAGSTAVSNGDASIQGWASGYLNYVVGPTPVVDAQWQDATQALGPAEGNSFNVVSLGDHGQITLTFPTLISNGPGADFAVFENSFNDTFLELAYVEASADGVNFIRFPSTSLTPSPVGFMGASVDATNIDGLAGKYRQGFGTPFDLSAIGLSYAKQIRIVDVVGDGSCLDSSGRVIYDPFPTTGSVGFDLDGAAALHFATATHVGPSGNWSNAPDWDLQVAPNGTGAPAIVRSATASKIIMLDVPVTLGTLTFDDAGSGFTSQIAGSNPLTMDAVSGPAAVVVNRGSHTISAPVVLAKDTQFTIGQTAAPASLAITGSLIAAGRSITVSAGSPASTLILPSFSAASLNINSGIVRVVAGGGQASVVGALGIASSARLDLGNGQMIVEYSGDSPVATIRQYLLNGRGPAGFGNATWNGAGGIISSNASPASQGLGGTGNGVDPAIGYAENSALPIQTFTSFGGQTVGANSILIKYTRGADATLDGVVDNSDVTVVGTEFNSPGSGQWFLGDFDYSGVCDNSDVTALGVLFNPTAPPLLPAQLTAQFGEQFAAAFEEGRSSAVPEPVGFLWTSVLPFLFIRRTRRQMRKLIEVAAILMVLMVARSARSAVINFEDLSVPAAGFYNGSDGAGGFDSGGAHFNNTFTDFGGGFTAWDGFAYSNRTDTTTPGFGNQYSAITGSGAGGSANYAVGFVGTPTIALPAGALPMSVMVTNTTYAYLSMKNGDSFAKKFGGSTGNDPDYFKLMITGLNAADQVVGTLPDFYLADYRFADNSQDYIVNTWTPVDLSPLAGASKLTFDLASSDNSFGFMNTPGYFALDNLVVTPEPGAAIVAIGGLAGIWMRRRRAGSH